MASVRTEADTPALPGFAHRTFAVSGVRSASYQVGRTPFLNAECRMAALASAGGKPYLGRFRSLAPNCLCTPSQRGTWLFFPNYPYLH
jgi:hypothetical protein